MNDKLRYATKLSANAALTFAKINLLALVSTIAVGIIGFVVFSRNVDAGRSAHVSALPFITMLFTSRPVGATLWFLNFSLFPILFFIVGNKYILTKLANVLINDNAESYIVPALDKLFDKFSSKQPAVIKNSADFAMNKLQLIQEVKNDTSQNRWYRRVIVFAMKKVNVNDIDFSVSNQIFKDVIRVKIIEKLQAMSTPSKKPIYILLGIQLLVLLIIWKTRL
jgi:hypothetical protein